MISQDAFQAMIKQSPPLAAMTSKVQEVIRDHLSPSEQVVGFYAVQVAGSAGVLCLTQNDIYGFWTQKIFFFMKFPAVQTFHLAHLRSLEAIGPSLALRAQSDPIDSPEDFEENTFIFTSAAEAEKFAQQVHSIKPQD